MTNFQFNTMTTTNRIMAYANRQHHLSVYQAKHRIVGRAIKRCVREQRRATALAASVMVASLIGMAVAAWFLTSVGAH